MTSQFTPLPPLKLPAGACLVPTVPLRLVRVLGREALELAGILLLVGPPGTGKTSAVIDLCSGLDVEVIWLPLEDTTKGNEVVRKVLEQLGEDDAGSGTALRERAREALENRVLVIAVDEAHQLHIGALRQIRYLFDQPASRFLLVLVGRDFSDTWRKAPELQSRIARRVSFEPLRGAELRNALAAFHPVLAATDKALLDRIDGECCRGNWRTWSHVVEAAVQRGATAETGITTALAGSVLGSVPPTPIEPRRMGR